MGGSSKKVTVGYKYYLGMHMVLCHGVVDELQWVSVNKKVAWSLNSTDNESININSPELFGGESREGGVSGIADIEFGGDGQGKNAYLQAQIDPDVPAFRGVFGIIFKQFYLGVNPYLKKWSFRVSRIHKRKNGLAQWYDNVSEISGGMKGLFSDWEYQIVPNDLPAGFYPPATGWIQGESPFGLSGETGGFDPFFGIRTEWEPDNAIWMRTSIQTLGLTPITIKGEVENAAWIFFDGILIGSVNPTNEDSTQLIPFSFVVNVETAPKGTHYIYIYAMDDFEDYGTADNTYFYCIVGQHKDMNPAHIIRECLTDEDWGMGYPEADIDDESFRNSADVLFNERMGMSLLWSGQTPITDFINEILRHIDAAVFVDRESGLFVLKLIRDDYDVGGLITLDENNVGKIQDVTLPSIGELPNSITVNYWNPQTDDTSSVTVDDPALIQMQNSVINTTVQYVGFTNHDIAARVGLRDLKALSSPLLSCTIYANTIAENFSIGEVFLFTWEDLGITELPMRVTGLTLGDGNKNEIRINAVQDQFSTPDVSLVSLSTDTWEPIGGAPVQSDNRLAIEAPYYEAVQSSGQTATDQGIDANSDIGYHISAASRPANAINAILSIDSGSGYTDAPILDFCPYAELKTSVNKVETLLSFENGVDLDLISMATHFQIGNEICRIDSINLIAETLTAGRGCLDTTPDEHSIGAKIFFWDEYAQTDGIEYVASDSLNVKIRPVTNEGALALASAPVDVLVLDSRAVRPYPAGNFKLDGGYYPASIAGSTIDVTWSDRNRIQQTDGNIIDHTFGNITKEAGTTYTVKVFNESLVLEQEFTGLTGNSKEIDLSTLPTLIATVELLTVRDSYYAWQSSINTFSFLLDSLFVMFPLTYDEEDYNDEMTWASNSGVLSVTPDGFEGNGWNERLKSTTIPSWMQDKADPLLVHASILFYAQAPQNSVGDTAIHCGAGGVGLNQYKKIQLKVHSDPQYSMKAFISVHATTTVDTYASIPLCRPEWEYRGGFPELISNTYEARPQGILFLDSTTLLISCHYEDNESKVFKINLTTNAVIGEFTFGTSTHQHIASFAESADGDIWCVDYDTDHTLEIDLTNSFSTGNAVILSDWDTSVIGGVSGIAFITVTAVDYILIAQYGTSGTKYLYVIEESEMGDGLTFALVDRYKRFDAGLTLQGVAIDNDGDLWLSRNTDELNSRNFGYIENYGVATTLISGTADDAVITLVDSFGAPSRYIEDIDFHPTSGDIWTMTEGWESKGDHDGWLSLWSSKADGIAIFHHFTILAEGGNFTVRINNFDFQTESWIINQDVTTVTIGGNPQPTADDFSNGFFRGFIKNIRFQNQDFVGSQYADTIDGSSFEPNSLTEYTISLTNAGAEAGDNSGWTNETGTITAKNSASRDIPEGDWYFDGGSNISTIASQQINIISETGLTGTEIDNAVIWGKLRWRQSGWSNTDPFKMGLRMLDVSLVETSEDFSVSDSLPFADGANGNYVWLSNALGVYIASGDRNIDIVYDVSRSSGTNNDGYLDDVKLKIFVQ